MSWMSKTELIDSMKTLCDKYESVGKTVDGNDIWMFSMGPSDAPKVLIDAAMHGMETYTSHTIYFMVKHIIESATPEAELIKRLRLCLIPIVNYDRWVHAGNPIYRKNNRPDPVIGVGCEAYTDPPRCNGVDLNRNFVHGWRSSADTLENHYSGSFAASEPETQALRTRFDLLKPKVYINMHDFGGEQSTLGDLRFPSYMGSSYQQECEALYTEYQQISQRLGLGVWAKKYSGANGFARDDAAVAGAIAILNEEYSGSPSYNTVKDELALRLEALVSAVATIYGEKQKYVFKQWQDGDKNPIKEIDVKT